LKIAVLGGGNGSFAAAGDFALQGHEVSLWRRDAAQVATHRAAGSRIIVKDANGRHDVQLALVTSDIAEAVREAELILCPAPAFAQPDIANLLAPHLADGQVVFLPPATFGSMIFAKAAYDSGNHAKRQLCRDRHAAMADAQAWSVRSRHHHPRQAAAGRRVSA
jgi:opine dehydrogenase